METKKRCKLLYFLCHKATLVVAGILALIIAGVSIFINAQSSDPTGVLGMRAMDRLHCDNLNDWIVSFNAGVTDANFSQIHLYKADGTENPLEQGSMYRASLRLIFTEPLMNGATYTLVVDAGALMPANPNEIRYTFTANCEPQCAPSLTHIIASSFDLQNPNPETLPNMGETLIRGTNANLRYGITETSPNVWVSVIFNAPYLNAGLGMDLLQGDAIFFAPVACSEADIDTVRGEYLILGYDEEGNPIPAPTAICVKGADGNILGEMINLEYNTKYLAFDMKNLNFDTDCDGIVDEEDNCVSVYNAGQENTDISTTIETVKLDTTTVREYQSEIGTIILGVGDNNYFVRLGSADGSIQFSRDGVNFYSEMNISQGQTFKTVLITDGTTTIVLRNVSYINTILSFDKMITVNDNIGDACDCDDTVCTKEVDINGQPACPKDPACPIENPTAITNVGFSCDDLTKFTVNYDVPITPDIWNGDISLLLLEPIIPLMNGMINTVGGIDVTMESPFTNRTTYTLQSMIGGTMLSNTFTVDCGATGPSEVTAMKLTNPTCDKIYDWTIAFNVPVEGVTDPRQIVLLGEAGNPDIYATDVYVNTDGTLRVIFDQTNLPLIGKTYTLTIKPHTLKPDNSDMISYKITVTCIVDTDKDGVEDGNDNCPFVPNENQKDSDVGTMKTVTLTTTAPTYTQGMITVKYDGKSMFVAPNGYTTYSKDKITWLPEIDLVQGHDILYVKYADPEVAVMTQLYNVKFDAANSKVIFDVQGEGDGVGDACDCDDKLCTEGVDCNGKLICDPKDPACISDADGDGIPDDKDECIKVPGKPEFYGCPSRLRVSVEEIDASTKPASHQDTALVTKVFDANPGSCAYNVGIQPQNYEQIRNTCTAENTKKETYSPNDGNKPRNLISDLVGLGVTKGTKLVLVKSLASVDSTFGYMGFDLPNMTDGESRDVGFNIVPGQQLNYVQTSVFTKNTKGLRESLRRAQVIKGSELQIFQPDYIIWNGTEKIYPFAFVSDGDRTVDVCLSVPEGYKIVDPGTCTQELIKNETKVVEFTAVDVGSPKEFDAFARIKVNHKGKTTNVDLKVKSFNPNKKDNKVRQRINDLFFK